MIDFHCHLDLYPEPLQVARECQRRGIYVLSVTTTPSAWLGTNALSPRDGRIRTALGLHPQLAHERYSELDLFDQLVPQTAYVGEIGLDGGPEFKAHWAVQMRVFEHILNSCTRAGGRILSVHSRHASNDVLKMVEQHPSVGTPVLHWFTGTKKDVERANELGCWFSVGPAMLRSERGRSVFGLMRRNRILTESDGPFAKLDGVPVLPWHVDEAVRCISEVWRLPTYEVDAMLHENLADIISTSVVTAGALRE